MAVELDLHRLEALALDGDALAQGFELGLGRVALDPHPVLAQPAGRGQFQPALQLAVVGQQQQALGVEVKPARPTSRGACPRAGGRTPCRGPFRRRPRSPALRACSRARGAAVRAGPRVRPATVILSEAVTFRAGEVMTLPLTVTSPSSIIRSASRREATPARERTLAMRSPSGCRRRRVLAGGLFFSGHGRHPSAAGAWPAPGVSHPRTPVGYLSKDERATRRLPVVHGRWRWTRRGRRRRGARCRSGRWSCGGGRGRGAGREPDAGAGRSDGPCRDAGDPRGVPGAGVGAAGRAMIFTSRWSPARCVRRRSRPRGSGGFTTGRRTRNRAGSRSGRGSSATRSATMCPRSMTGSGGARRRRC